MFYAWAGGWHQDTELTVRRVGLGKAGSPHSISTAVNWNEPPYWFSYPPARKPFYLYLAKAGNWGPEKRKCCVSHKEDRMWSYLVLYLVLDFFPLPPKLNFISSSSPQLLQYVLICSRHKVSNNKKTNPALDLPEGTVPGWANVTFPPSSCLVAGVALSPQSHSPLSTWHCLHFICVTVLRRLYSLAPQIHLERTYNSQSCCHSLTHSIHSH